MNAKFDHAYSSEHLNKLPRFEQTQVSLEEQLQRLRSVANRLGLHDAADFLAKRAP